MTRDMPANRPIWSGWLWLLWGSVFLAIWSAIVYFRDFWKLMGGRIFDADSRLNEEGRMPVAAPERERR